MMDIKINHREDEKLFGPSQYILIWNSALGILSTNVRIVPCDSWSLAIVKVDIFEHDQNCFCEA